jgi:hypothetical protein
MSWTEIDCSSSRSIARLAVHPTTRKIAIQFSKSKKCLLFPAVPLWALSKVLRSGSLQQSGGLWSFISNATFCHARKNFPQCVSAVMNELESLTMKCVENSGESDFNTSLDDFECIEVDCSLSAGLQRMAVLYQCWAGGDVMLCVQYQGQLADSCFLYSNVALNRILQIIQSHSKSAQIQQITSDERTVVSKLPNFPRCTDTPMTVGRSSPLCLNTFQPISQ